MMIPKKNTKSETETMYAFIKDFWIFIKKYLAITDTDEYWDSFLDAGDALAVKYIDVPAAKALIVAFMREREEHAKKISVHG